MKIKHQFSLRVKVIPLEYRVLSTVIARSLPGAAQEENVFPAAPVTKGQSYMAISVTLVLNA